MRSFLGLSSCILHSVSAPFQQPADHPITRSPDHPIAHELAVHPIGDHPMI
jgi:hypothetical protein